MQETIFDPLRKKHVALTPEESVRQYFIKWLHSTKGYPMELMASEYTIKFNKMNYRCDIVAFNKKIEPILLVECKAPNVEINNSVIDQVIRYNMVLKVPLIIITNGAVTYACGYNCQQQSYQYLTDIPEYK
ncbi:MAG: type I restriction enzyme HsdR N-terminal domain-containing protein [Bacteroidia bacterium]|nr:type I restriction enzyme HsdR N-terminal domain-containing protein [Bacteroidia bacterium]